MGMFLVQTGSDDDLDTDRDAVVVINYDPRKHRIYVSGHDGTERQCSLRDFLTDLDVQPEALTAVLNDWSEKDTYVWKVSNYGK